MSNHLRLGLALGALFAWLLAFPLFGPLLMTLQPEAGSALGLWFLFAHGGTLVVLGLLPPGLFRHRWALYGPGLTLFLGTLLCWRFPSAVLLVLMAAAASVLVLAWAPAWVGAGAPLWPLAGAMAGANFAVAVAALPGLPPAAALPVLGLLGLASALLIGQSPAAPIAGTARLPAWPLLIPLLAFAVADYFVGGLWYVSVTVAFSAGSPWQPLLESLFSSLAIAAVAYLVRPNGPSGLARYSLSLLGMGLVLTAAGAWLPLSRGLLLLGLVAGDLFYWGTLGTLARTVGARRTFGLGLGLSLCLIGLSNVTAGRIPVSTGGPAPVFLLTGAAVLFAMLPLVYRVHVTPLPAPTEATPEPPPEAPPGLTPTERQVYEQLCRGAADAEIAAALVVSRHTVKFHVRNILHKLGVANRKELLSRLVAGKRP